VALARPGRAPAGRFRNLALAVVVAVSGAVGVPGLARRANAGPQALAFVSTLRGMPFVDCLIVTDADACGGPGLSGSATRSGSVGFDGSFAFDVPGARPPGHAPRQLVGRGLLVGSIVAVPGGPARRCEITGKVTALAVSLPAEGASGRFLTGTFAGRGECDDGRIGVRAIWSGAITRQDGEFTGDFEHFEGHLVGAFVSSRRAAGTP
jgi:hypothetical protein